MMGKRLSPSKDSYIGLDFMRDSFRETFYSPLACTVNGEHRNSVTRQSEDVAS